MPTYTVTDLVKVYRRYRVNAPNNVAAENCYVERGVLTSMQEGDVQVVSVKKVRTKCPPTR